MLAVDFVVKGVALERVRLLDGARLKEVAMPSPEEVDAALTGPGAPFEMVDEPVLGVPLRVFKNRPRSLRDVLLASRERFAGREFIVFGDQRVTFEEHYRAVCRVAGRLRALGVDKGDRVAILAANCPPWCVTFWAATCIGAIPVGLNGWWKRDEIEHAIADCSPSVLVADEKRFARLEALELHIPVLSTETDFAGVFGEGGFPALPDVAIDEDDPASILYTSGTTGRAKGALHSHRNLIALTSMQAFYGARAAMLMGMSGDDSTADEAPQSVALISTPLFHVSGLYAGIVSRMAFGSKTVWTVGKFDAEQVLSLIEREKIGGWGPTATMLHRVLNHPRFSSFDTTSLQFVGLGGSPISPTLLELARDSFKRATVLVGVGYGLTEGTALATLIAGPELEEHPGSVGRAMPTVQLAIRNADGKMVPEGVEGDIWIRSPLVMLGYWNDEVATATKLDDKRWLRTGDFGFMKEGRLHISARKRDLIIRGGENIYPPEIEMRLAEHPGVLEAAVIGVDHDELGQEVKAIVVPSEHPPPSHQELEAFAAETLAYFKVPTRWQTRLMPLPRNASGKVMKHELGAPDESPPDTAD